MDPSTYCRCSRMAGCPRAFGCRGVNWWQWSTRRALGDLLDHVLLHTPMAPSTLGRLSRSFSARTALVTPAELPMSIFVALVP